MSQGEEPKSQEVDPGALPWDEPEDPYLSSLPWDEQVELEEKRLAEMENENLLNREKIVSHFPPSMTQSAQFKKMSYQPQEKESIIDEKQWDIKDMEKKNQELQGKLDQALEKIKEILQEKKQQDMRQRQMHDQLEKMEIK